MKEIGKRLIAVLAALALVFSVFTVGSDTTEVKAEQAQAASTYYEELTVTDTQENVEYTVKNLTVASCGSITLGSKGDDNNSSHKMSIVRVTGRAEVDGQITLRGDSGMEGVLEIGKNAVLDIHGGTLIQTDDQGYILAEEGASVISCGLPVDITVDNESVVINGSQKFSCMIFCVNGAWSGSKVDDITLPGDKQKLNDWLGMFPDIKFKTVTIKDRDPDTNYSYDLAHSFKANKLVVDVRNELKINASEEDGAKIPTIVDVDEAILNDTVKIADIPESSDACNQLLIRNKLTIESNGKIVAKGNGYLDLESGGQPREITIPSLADIEPDREVRITKGSKILYGGGYLEYGVKFGELSEHNVKFDGSANADDDYIFIFKGSETVVNDAGPESRKRSPFRNSRISLVIPDIVTTGSTETKHMRMILSLLKALL